MCELTDLAGFAGTAPGGSQCGAALRLQCGSVDVDLTAVVLYRQPARTLHTVCGAEVTQTTFSVSHDNMSCTSFTHTCQPKTARIFIYPKECRN